MPDESDVDVVLSGLSGRLPESDTIDEFAEQLFAGVDLVTADDRRWTPGLYGLPKRNGKIKNLSHFDATFFGVHFKQADIMDPQLRILLELVHEAIVDAGISPTELRGSMTGVFVGVSCLETIEMLLKNPNNINDGYAIIGSTRAMLPNRISYTFDLRGPSYAIDTACSSSSFALVHAVNAIREGHCNAAIVAASHLCLNPIQSLGFLKMTIVSPEGHAAPFDASADGYVRSEAIVVVLLQRRSTARRVYCTVRGVGTNTDGYKEQGITFPSGAVQQQLARETFEQAGLRPQDVDYIEAHATGTKVGDPEEINSIAELFCAGRSRPLLMGSVKSNIGHTEPASGLCSLVKVILSMELGALPPNLRYENPNPAIPALIDGRVKVVDEKLPWDGGLVAINSFGFGGANALAILESERGPLPKDEVIYTIPRLVCASGRTEEAVRVMLETAAQNPRRGGLHALLDAVHKYNIPGHSQRGYMLLTDKEQPVLEVQETKPRPVWFVFSGMGSQWAGMGKQLMKLRTFAASIDRCAAALQPYDIDLKTLLTDAPESEFDKVMNSFVSITAMQVGLIDVLRELGLNPDGIIGHSAGEVACAYADDTLTAEQTVLCAYWRSRSVLDSKSPPGAMAVVGLSWEEFSKQRPPDIVLACDNSADSVTVSGPIPAVESLLERLAAQGTFARRINSSGYAFHSKYIASAGPLLLQSLQKLIDKPKRRSSKWVSSSLPKDLWNSDKAKFSDAAYSVNNLLSPVLFRTALQEVPEGALVVEVAPHALLQSILKRALPTSTVFGLMRKDAANPLHHFLCAIGKIYCGGAQPEISKLYPPVSWPVCRGTPGLASKIKWDHSHEWKVVRFESQTRSGENSIEIDLSTPENEYITGHNIDGRVLFPATGYMKLVWNTIAKIHKKEIEKTAIILEDVHFKRATIMSDNTPTWFLVAILEGSGEFSICEGGEVAVTGRVRLVDNPNEERLLEVPASELDLQDKEPLLLKTKDIYKELRLRGYYYKGEFKGIKSSNLQGNNGELAWNGNWVSFMDTMLQFGIISSDARDLYLPDRLQQVLIDPTSHPMPGPNIPIRINKDLDVIIAGGVEIRGLNTRIAPRRANNLITPKLERHVFVPLDNSNIIPKNCEEAKKRALTICLQLILENTDTLKLKVTEAALGRSSEELLTPIAIEIMEEEPQLAVEACVVVDDASCYKFHNELRIKVQVIDDTSTKLDSSCHCFLASKVLETENISVLNKIIESLGDGGMILLQESISTTKAPKTKEILRKFGLSIITKQPAETVEYVLLRKKVHIPPSSLIIEIADDNKYEWVAKLRNAIQTTISKDTRIYLWSKASYSGILGLSTCLKKEVGGQSLRIYYIPGSVNAFIPSSDIFKEQVELDIYFNVRKNNLWGTMRHLPLVDDEVSLKVEHAYVNTTIRGDLASLRWIESPLRWISTMSLPEDMDLCKVHYAPINFKDIMLATGKLLPEASPISSIGDAILGLEFSGYTSDGNRVMGMVECQGLATTVLAYKDLLLKVPQRWTLEQAATVPVAYATAYLALCIRGNMLKGESVLIHAGAGGVGLAAISIALGLGCKVYTTVGSPEKRAFLLKRFPQLDKDNIGNSRDSSFEQLIRKRTKGRGVDLVLNSFAGELLFASIRCLGVGGRFLEIGKFDISNNTEIGMSMFNNNKTFHGIALNEMIGSAVQHPHRKAVMDYIKEGLASGIVQPLPSNVYPDDQLERAFRFMASGKHIGKVMLRIRNYETDDQQTNSNKIISAIPRTYMHHSKTYILVGGLGGIGLELASWLVNRGATKLILNSRNGVRTGYQAWRIHVWRQAGVIVHISTSDCTTRTGAEALIKEAAALAPVGGVFNLAVVLSDALMVNQTEDQFKAVTLPKVKATKELDAATRAFCPYLDYFVAFSSVSSGRGNPGQSNYGYANSAMERICEARQADGLPGLAIQWGSIGDAGILVEHMGNDVLEISGTKPQNIASCLSVLDKLLDRPDPIVASMVVAEKKRDQKSETTLINVVSNILGIKDPSKVSDNITLVDLGMDSLMGTEIKQTLERNYDILLGVQEIRLLTFAKLKQLGGEKKRTSDPRSAFKSELISEQVLLKLPSAADATSNMRPIFLVHPMEGIGSMFVSIASSIKAPALALQCTLQAPLDSMSSLASFYLTHVRERQPDGPYVLVGYSFGAAAAFEIALQLEAAGCVIRLVLVDGSPEFTATYTTTVAEESKALAYYAALSAPVDSVKLAAQLEALPDSTARVNLLKDLVPDHKELIEGLAMAFYKRINIAKSYKPSRKLKSSVDLFRVRNDNINLGEDYGLRAICEGEVHVTLLPGTHRDIIEGDQAKVIAEHVTKLLNL